MMAIRQIFQRRPPHNTPHHYDTIPEEAHDRYYHVNIVKIK
jgi:hypothetical protein